MSPDLEVNGIPSPTARLGSSIVWFKQFVGDVVFMNSRLMEEATTNSCGNVDRCLK